MSSQQKMSGGSWVCASGEDLEGMNCRLQLMMGGYGEESGAQWRGERPRARSAPRSIRRKTISL